MAHQLLDLVLDEVSIVDAPANKLAKVVLLKRQDPAGEVLAAIEKMQRETDAMLRATQAPRTGATHAENEMASLSEAITKSLDPDDSDTPSQRDNKRILKFALSKGLVTVEKVAADLALDAVAVTMRKANPALSPESAYVAAMEAHPDLASLAVGH